MKEIKTDELTNILGNTHLEDFESFCSDNSASLVNDATSFFTYFKELLHDKKITQQQLFIRADIPERYGYKLLSGEKHTKQRDVIIRLCYAGQFTLEQTQIALEKYEMAQLYPKIPRDAMLMIIFNERPGNILEVNEVLKKHEFEPLRTSGIQN